jgi:hypothetical protein
MFVVLAALLGLLVVQAQPTSRDECPEYPSGSYQESLKLLVQVDENNVADWSTLNGFDWKGYGATWFNVLITSPTFVKVFNRAELLGLLSDESLAEIVKRSGPNGPEMEQVAGLMDVPLKYVACFTFFYEIAGGCTASVANGHDGTMVHGRNMEYEEFSMSVYELDATVIFVDPKGDELYVCQTWIGMVGCTTGMSKDKFSVNINQRYTGEDTVEQMMKNLESVATQPAGSSWGYGFFFRDQLFQPGNTFDAFSAKIVEVGDAHQFVNGAYVTAAGTTHGQGAIHMTPNQDPGEGQFTTTRVARIGGTNDVSLTQCGSTWCFQTNQDDLTAKTTFNGKAVKPSEQFRSIGGRDNLKAALAECPAMTPQLMVEKVQEKCPTMIVCGPKECTPSSFVTVQTMGMNAATGYYKGMGVQNPKNHRTWGSRVPWGPPAECPAGRKASC